MKKVHKLVYIPYTGWYHLCTNSDRYMLAKSQDWKNVTCRHCLKRRDKDIYDY